jgi:hypothetical protein
MHDVVRMNEQDLSNCPRGADPASTPAAVTDRPLRICVVFDDDDSAWSAELLIRQVAAGYDSEKQSFRFDELEPPAPGVAAARGASNSDIFVLAVRDERTLPLHIKSWLRLCIGLREEDQDGALVVLIAEAAESSNAGSSLLDYLETVAITGRLAFFPSRRGMDGRMAPARKEVELEDMVCGSSD